MIGINSLVKSGAMVQTLRLSKREFKIQLITVLLDVPEGIEDNKVQQCLEVLAVGFVLVYLKGLSTPFKICLFSLLARLPV